MRAFAIPISASLSADDVSSVFAGSARSGGPEPPPGGPPGGPGGPGGLDPGGLQGIPGGPGGPGGWGGFGHLPANFQVARADLLHAQVLANVVLHNLPIGRSPVLLSYLPMLAANQAP